MIQKLRFPSSIFKNSNDEDLLLNHISNYDSNIKSTLKKESCISPDVMIFLFLNN